jgi:hypothetical protein
MHVESFSDVLGGLLRLLVRLFNQSWSFHSMYLKKRCTHMQLFGLGWVVTAYFLCNGQYDPDHCAMDIKTIFKSLEQSELGRTYKLTSRVWVLVGLLQLLVRLFNQIFLEL